MMHSVLMMCQDCATVPEKKVMKGNHAVQSIDQWLHTLLEAYAGFMRISTAIAGNNKTDRLHGHSGSEDTKI